MPKKRVRKFLICRVCGLNQNQVKFTNIKGNKPVKCNFCKKEEAEERKKKRVIEYNEHDLIAWSPDEPKLNGSYVVTLKEATDAHDERKLAKQLEDEIGL